MTQVGSGVLCNGYFVRILEGDVCSSPSGHSVELQDGSNFRIFIMNNNMHMCQMEIRRGRQYIGTYLLQGRSAYIFDQPAESKNKFVYSQRDVALKDVKLSFFPEKYASCMKFHAFSFIGGEPRSTTLEVFDFNTYRELRSRLERALGLLSPIDLLLRVSFPNPRQHGQRSVEAVLPRHPTDSFLYHYHFSELISEDYSVAAVRLRSLHVVNSEGQGVAFDLSDNIPTVRQFLEEVLNCDKFGDVDRIRLTTAGGRNIYLPHWRDFVPFSDDSVLTMFKVEELLKSEDVIVRATNEHLTDLSQFHIYLKSVTEVKNGVILYGKSVMLRRVDKYMSVEILQQLVQQKEGIPTMYQRLIFNGILMQRGLSLGDYHLHIGSTVHLVLQLLGRSDMHLDVKVKKVNEVVSIAEDLPDAEELEDFVNEGRTPRPRFVPASGIPVDLYKATDLDIELMPGEDEYEEQGGTLGVPGRARRKKVKLRVDYQEGEKLDLSIHELDRSYDTSGTESEQEEEGGRRKVLVKKLTDIMVSPALASTPPGNDALADRFVFGDSDDEAESKLAPRNRRHKNVVAVIEKRGSKVVGSRIQVLGSQSSDTSEINTSYGSEPSPTHKVRSPPPVALRSPPAVAPKPRRPPPVPPKRFIPSDSADGWVEETGDDADNYTMLQHTRSGASAYEDLVFEERRETSSTTMTTVTTTTTQQQEWRAEYRQQESQESNAYEELHRPALADADETYSELVCEDTPDGAVVSKRPLSREDSDATVYMELLREEGQGQVIGERGGAEYTTVVGEMRREEGESPPRSPGLKSRLQQLKVMYYDDGQDGFSFDDAGSGFVGRTSGESDHNPVPVPDILGGHLQSEEGDTISPLEGDEEGQEYDGPATLRGLVDTVLLQKYEDHVGGRLEEEEQDDDDEYPPPPRPSPPRVPARVRSVTFDPHVQKQILESPPTEEEDEDDGSVSSPGQTVPLSSAAEELLDSLQQASRDEVYL